MEIWRRNQRMNGTIEQIKPFEIEAEMLARDTTTVLKASSGIYRQGGTRNVYIQELRRLSHEVRLIQNGIRHDVYLATRN